MESVGALAGNDSELRGDFVAIFDSTDMVWPSVLSIPKIVSVLSSQPPPYELRRHTEAIAIVQGGTRWLTMLVGYLVDLVVAVTTPDVVPIFAASREAAEEALAQQLRHRR